MEAPETWFHRQATSYVEAQILFHLNQLGVFACLLDASGQTPEQLAQKLGLDARTTAVLLDYLYEVDELLERAVAVKLVVAFMGCLMQLVSV